MRGLEATVQAHLDRRLLRESPRPLAVALSGGGDSLALTLIADAWARAAGRELLVLTVDHGLQAQSRAWTAACYDVARRLGRPFRALSWDGPKPAAGLPAAARAARHRLLAHAGREAGARVILMGHTGDDVAEARAMRAAGATTPEPQAWAPSPAWPEGRGLFVLRPLLDARRADLRAWLVARGEPWIDDPANADPRYARSRARAALPAEAPFRIAPRAPLALAGAVTQALGVLTIDRAALRTAPAEAVQRLVALAVVCAGGGDKRPAGERITRLADALCGHAPFVATLAGARVEADGVVRIGREPGEAARGAMQPIGLPVGREIIWDGRYAVTARARGLTIRPVAGVAARLPRPERERLRDLPPALRRGLPVLVDAHGASSPVLTPRADVRIVDLVADRFRAAAGLVEREPA